jgi:hypothetical protein
VAKTKRHREWQSATVRRAFEVAGQGDVAAVVVDALREMAAAQAAISEENGRAFTSAATTVEKIDADEISSAEDRRLFHMLHTWCQPFGDAAITIVLASSGPAIRSVVNYEDTAVAAFEWMISNAIGFGIPLFLLPVVFFNKMSQKVRAAMFWFWILASAMVAGILVGVMWK